MFAPAQLPYTATAALLMSLQPILVSLSKNEAGGFDYSVPASTMLSELLKLLLSSGLLLRQMATCAPSELLSEQPWAEMLSYSLPGLIYFVNNNLVFVILQSICVLREGKFLSSMKPQCESLCSSDPTPYLNQEI